MQYDMRKGREAEAGRAIYEGERQPQQKNGDELMRSLSEANPNLTQVCYKGDRTIFHILRRSLSGGL